MSWEDRIQEAAYSSPSGTRIVFTYEDVSKNIDKRTSSFTFPDANGTYVQDLGVSGNRYPLRVFFWGTNYDVEIQNFENLLLERGVGRLEHPMYGTVNVVPFGTIARRDDLKTQANQGVLEVTFWETTGLVYPTGQREPSSAVLIAVDEFNETQAAQFSVDLVLDTFADAISLENTHRALLDRVKGGLQSVADAQDDVKRRFQDIYDSINNSLDTLVQDPITLALQTTQLIQTPARAAMSIADRLKAFGDLIADIVSNEATDSNNFHDADVFVSTLVTGSIISVVNNEFQTKSDALGAAEVISTQFDSVVQWRDATYGTLEQVDTGEAYQQLQEAVAVTIGYLVEISFTLKQARSVVLDREKTILELAAELYGKVDSMLDFLISSNKITGSEIIKGVPKGRTIEYYV